MRARNIKPQFFKSDQLSECSIWARMYFVGTWLLADREGRFEYRPKRIKIEIFPYDDVCIEELTRELEANGLLHVYEVGGEQFCYIPNFTKHQNPHNNEKSSELPHFTGGLSTKDESTLVKEESPSNLGSDDSASNPADSLLLNPETLNPETHNAHARTSDASGSFEKFWEAYPKKVGKQAALSAWKKSKTKPSIERVLEVLEQQKTGQQWRKDGGQFIPNPATWINQGRWDDEVSLKPVFEDVSEDAMCDFVKMREDIKNGNSDY